MPRPSDPPTTDFGARQRQRLTRLENDLEQTRSAVARQRREMNAMRSRLEIGEARVDELIEDLGAVKSLPELDARFKALEKEHTKLAYDLRHYVERMSVRSDALEQRIRTLEEGSELSRVRMRLERLGHQLEGVERRLSDLEQERRALRDIVSRTEATQTRVARLEELFEELLEELRQQQEGRDTDELRGRIDDLEALVLQTGSEERLLRQRLEEQTTRIQELSESVAPSPPSRDDLTRIKGIGPKYARLLEDAGVTSFAQVAAWTESDVEWIAERIGVKPSRIRKAGWIERAAELV